VINVTDLELAYKFWGTVTGLEVIGSETGWHDWLGYLGTTDPWKHEIILQRIDNAPLERRAGATAHTGGGVDALEDDLVFPRVCSSQIAEPVMPPSFRADHFKSCNCPPELVSEFKVGDVDHNTPQCSYTHVFFSFGPRTRFLSLSFAIIQRYYSQCE
jgi:hypothetical protein